MSDGCGSVPVSLFFNVLLKRYCCIYIFTLYNLSFGWIYFDFYCSWSQLIWIYLGKLLKELRSWLCNQSSRCRFDWERCRFMINAHCANALLLLTTGSYGLSWVTSYLHFHCSLEDNRYNSKKDHNPSVSLVTGRFDQSPFCMLLFPVPTLHTGQRELFRLSLCLLGGHRQDNVR